MAKEIRFINSSYKELFRIQDGDYIEVAHSNGEVSLRKCVYLDDYHTFIGNSVYHICEFAEIAERNGFQYHPEENKAIDEIVWKNGYINGPNHVYLLLQRSSDNFWDYSIYTKEEDGSFTLNDGGILEDSDSLSILEARKIIFEMFPEIKWDVLTEVSIEDFWEKVS